MNQVKDTLYSSIPRRDSVILKSDVPPLARASSLEGGNYTVIITKVYSPEKRHMKCLNHRIFPIYTYYLKSNVVHSWKETIPLSSVSDGIWSEPGNSKEFYIGNGDEAVEQAAVNSRADRLRSSVIHEQKHFLGERILQRHYELNYVDDSFVPPVVYQSDEP